LLKIWRHLVIIKREAMTNIDVNTGPFRHRNLEETIFQDQSRSRPAIARQLRTLAQTGGIIIIDLIIW